ncbi:hypothetical protein U1Q18_042920 [Sarracenia purpurea var. burkii]
MGSKGFDSKNVKPNLELESKAQWQIQGFLSSSSSYGFLPANDDLEVKPETTKLDWLKRPIDGFNRGPESIDDESMMRLRSAWITKEDEEGSETAGSILIWFGQRRGR